MIRLEKSNDSCWMPEEFESRKEFIAYTIEAARTEAQKGDEYENMTMYGFTEVIDKEETDEDGEILEYASHWEGDYEICKNYWEKWHGHVPGGHWIITEE